MIRVITREPGKVEWNNNFTARLLNVTDEKRRTRIVVRKGLEHILLKLEDVAMLYTENKVVFVYDREGKKYIGEKNLADIYTELDAKMFFRANRQYIVNAEFVKSYKSYEKVKLQVSLTIPELIQHSIIVSQENAPHFRKWFSDQ
ncbi:MAG TPA: LytTR family DNA-binding domain-containing protein [Chitinophagaceae bacterium]